MSNMDKVYLRITDGHGPVDIGCRVEDGILVDVLNSNNISIWDKLTLQQRATLARMSGRELNKPVTVNVQ
jgi:hypothetical protein